MALTDIGEDRELALRASHGDQLAFEDLYRRYFQRIYDLALRTVHDPDLAASVVQASFVRAWEALRRGPLPVNVRPWLFARAHDAAIEEIRHRTSAAFGAEQINPFDEAELARVEPSRVSDPRAVVPDRELVEIVWGATRSLTPKEYMLLDMSLRQGFSQEELADALGMRRASLDATLTRLKDELDETATYTLLLRRGPAECPRLAAALQDVEDPYQLDATSRAIIANHLEECLACSDRKRHYPSPVEVFSALAVVPLSLQARTAIWESVSDHLQRAALTSEPTLIGVGWKPAPIDRLPLYGAIGAGILVLLLVLFVIIRPGRASIHDPANVHSTSHEVGQPSASNVVAVSWQADPDAKAYAIRWSEQPRTCPRRTKTSRARPPAPAARRWRLEPGISICAPKARAAAGPAPSTSARSWSTARPRPRQRPHRCRPRLRRRPPIRQRQPRHPPPCARQPARRRLEPRPLPRAPRRPNRRPRHLPPPAPSRLRQPRQLRRRRLRLRRRRLRPRLRRRHAPVSWPAPGCPPPPAPATRWP
jgi:RNA polymerase sigma factor (sigma-70 family)